MLYTTIAIIAGMWLASRIGRLAAPRLFGPLPEGVSTAEIQDVMRGLLAQGAKLPKNLMLYVKDMLFFDGAVAQLAPRLNMFQEVARIYGYFAVNHGEKIRRDVGIDPRTSDLDLEGMKASMGLEKDVESITHKELQERRQIIQKRIEDAGGVSLD